MSNFLMRFNWYRMRKNEARLRAIKRIAAERTNAELNLAVEDYLFDGRLPKSAYEEEQGYKSAIGEDFQDEPKSSREDW